MREEMERAAARRLQPHFIRASLWRRSGSWAPRSGARIQAVRDHPRAGTIRERDRAIGTRETVLTRYDRVPSSGASSTLREAARCLSLHPATRCSSLPWTFFQERQRALLRQGAILVDTSDYGDRSDPASLWRMCFRTPTRTTRGIGTSSRGGCSFRGDHRGSAPSHNAGYAPYLSLPSPDGGSPYKSRRSWTDRSCVLTWRQKAVSLAIPSLVPRASSGTEGATGDPHHEDRTLKAVHERLPRRSTSGATAQSELKAQDRAAGKEAAAELRRTSRARTEDLADRIESRKKELEASAELQYGRPSLLAARSWCPLGLLAEFRGEDLGSRAPMPKATRAGSKMLAMKA